MSKMGRWIVQQEQDNDIRSCRLRNDTGLDEDTSSGCVSPELWEEYCVLQRYATKGSLDRYLYNDWTQPDRLRSA